MTTNPLIGATLTGVDIAADRLAIRFRTTGGDVVVNVDADCCSYSWVEHVELPAGGLPARVLSVDALDMPEGAASDFHPHSDVLAFYGCKIVTDRGDIVIDYRNDSNGYYGGSLVWPGERLYGGVYSQNIFTYEWRSLVDA